MEDQRKVRFLHISDLHLERRYGESSVESFNQSIVNKSLLLSIRENIIPFGKIDFVVITGDLTKSGKIEEYQVAGEFIQELMHIADLKKDNIFIVPGNHDIDRNDVTKEQLKTIYRYENQDDITERFTSIDFLEIFRRKFKNFFDFVNKYTNEHYESNNFYFVDEIQPINSNLKVAILGLNSCVFSGDNRDGERKLALGIHQVNQALEAVSKNDTSFKIAAFHHPPECLHECDEPAVNKIKSNVDLILTGHLHKPMNAFISNGSDDYVIIGAGASYETRQTQNSFGIIELDIKNRNGSVQFYKYLSDHDKWIVNSEINSKNTDGIFSFEFRNLDKVNVKKEKIKDKISEAKELISEYYENGVRKPLKDHPPVTDNFVGREKDLEKLDDLAVRVSAVTGLGGVGKSALAAKIFGNAVQGKLKRNIEICGWSDCKDLETPFHDKILDLVDYLTDGKQSKSKYAEEPINDSIVRFRECLNARECLVVFDNVDAFVNVDQSSLTGNFGRLFEELVSGLNKSLVIFTCRSSVRHHSFIFSEVPVTGLSLEETIELSKKYNLSELEVSAEKMRYLHQETKGHALALNLIFGQLRTGRSSVDKITEIILSNAEYLDKALLNSIWSALKEREREIVYIISTFIRPPDIKKISSVSKENYKNCCKAVRILVAQSLVQEVDIIGETHYDLHPIIRVRAKGEFKNIEKESIISRVIAALGIVQINPTLSKLAVQTLTGDHLEDQVECAEIMIEEGSSVQATEYVWKVTRPLLDRGEDTKLIQLAEDLISKFILTFEVSNDGNEKYFDIYCFFINALLNQGDFEKSKKYIISFEREIKTIREYIIYSNMNMEFLWYQDRFEDAIEFYKESFIKITEKNERMSANTDMHYALSLRDNGSIKEALDLFNSFIDQDGLSKWIKDPEEQDKVVGGISISAVAGNISRCMYLLGDYQGSLQLLERVLIDLRKGISRSDKVNLGYGLIWLVDISVKINDRDKAKKSLGEVMDVWGKYCPSRLKKVRKHFEHYSEESKKYFGEKLLEKIENLPSC